MMTWECKVSGKKFHSGLPHKGINAIECAQRAVQDLQAKFFKQFPAHEKEKEYKFVCSSSMKPTQIFVPPGGINQIPGECTIKGDIRFLPFYDGKEIADYMRKCAEDLDVNSLPCLGQSRYELPDEGLKAKIEFKFFDEAYKGMAADLESPGYKALFKAIDKHHKGGAKPFALTGSLPIIADLQEAGYDVQIVGFGRMDAYHAVDEYAMISEYAEGFEIAKDIISQFQNQN